MSELEKAKQLINKFFNAVPHRNTSRKLAVKLALICVEEIIEETNEQSILFVYWNNVKELIV